MASISRKRKHRTHPFHDRETAEALREPDQSLYIQAHEADVIRGPQAQLASESLEVNRDENDASRIVRVGDGLIKWDPVGNSGLLHDDQGSNHNSQHIDDVQGIWVDRYDARLLLDALPPPNGELTKPERYSPTGWSDLPSDTEDTFFFSPEEAEDYRRQKRRRLIDQARQDRLDALRAEENDDEALEEEIWGGSDEEPDDTQRELMRRTASHILTSPNPAQLELRILANHGADHRFAFLRGRWSRAWKLTRGQIKMDMQKEKTEKGSLPALGGLTGYGDSDEENTRDTDEEGPGSQKEGIGQDGAATKEKGVETIRTPAEDAVKEARRARAKEWAEKRRTMQAEG